MRQNILIFVGMLGIVLGVIFMLQGLGIFRYPADSFMIDSRDWIIRGAVLAALGAILIAGIRLVATKRSGKRDGDA